MNKRERDIHRHLEESRTERKRNKLDMARAREAGVGGVWEGDVIRRMRTWWGGSHELEQTWEFRVEEEGGEKGQDACNCVL